MTSLRLITTAHTTAQKSPRIQRTAASRTSSIATINFETNPDAMRRVALFGLGGTIASLPAEVSSAGVVPSIEASELVHSVPGLEAVARVESRTLRQMPSANFSFADVVDVADAIHGAFASGVDGVVVTQGTDNIEETSFEDFQRLFRVNVDGTFLVTRAALPLLLASRGSIVNIGSVAGMVGVKRRFAYCATKGAVHAMTHQLATDYPKEIRVNCIAPGTVDTAFVEGYLEKYHSHEKDKVRAELNQRQPMGRLGRPEEIAYLALYLCSPASDFMNGAILPIDGGWTAA